ncbi:hypothetical protein [Bradyrhizobium sp. IC4059]|uniref:hypothetical protein n=1 Tax=Bradyrhizobium sp. IC4059 TaxID=2793805 RepID=UPI001CD60307|nr:hypothetical protein [Bradyrhizobium sp. IC4059]MCA1360788.1 hypothetical protein [Bradyrhizobium sp. IC4059]
MISPPRHAYLHYTFDLWAERSRRQEAHGDIIIVRDADDLVVGFEHEDTLAVSFMKCVNGLKHSR